MRLGLVIGWLMVCGTVEAASLTGNKLLQMCASPSGSVGDIACDHFIEGFAAGVDYLAGDKVICFPNGVTVNQGRLVVEKFMRENPEKLHTQAALLVGAAFRRAFPCKISN